MQSGASGMQGEVLEGAYETEGEGFFSQADSDRARGDSFKLKEERYRLGVGRSSLLRE